MKIGLTWFKDGMRKWEVILSRDLKVRFLHLVKMVVGVLGKSITISPLIDRLHNGV